MNYSFNYDSSTARKARTFVWFNSVRRLTLILFAAVVITSGVLLAASHKEIGLFVIGVGFLLLLPIIWYKYELKHLPSRHDMQLENALDAEVVGRLKNIETPHDIWAATKGTWQQRFFSIRFGVLPEMFEEHVSHQPQATIPTLQKAQDLAQQHKQTHISTGALLVALVHTMPNVEGILAQLELTTEDLERSIDWLQHTEMVEKRLDNERAMGGIARNWIGGYTPLLTQLSFDMSLVAEQSGMIQRDFSAHSETVNGMLPMLSSGKRNAILVGKVGSGKTTTMYSLAQRLLSAKDVPKQLAYARVLTINAQTLIAHAQKSGGLEALLDKLFIEASKAKNIVLFMDEASAFFEEGVGSVDISRLLEPVLASGSVPLVLALEPVDWQSIKQNHTNLAIHMNQILLEEPNEFVVMEVLEDQTLLMEAEHEVTFTYRALKEAYRLSSHYLQDIAMPGRALKVLDMAINFDDRDIITYRSVQLGVEQAFGVKVQAASKAAKRELLQLEDKIHTHMINQTRAVKVVADALRRAQSGVSDSERPIGSFLFLGPTGVGKTQLAKSLAIEYFNGQDEIIRVDMNEFVQAKDTSRLIDSTNPNSLLSQVQRNPFNVVLLDEIEKADSSVVNALLQMLDEGVMRDSTNTVVSFRDTIVIATSNAGADSIREKVEQGKELRDFEAEFIDQLINSKQFAPELLNRFDEIVLFRPLKPQELILLVDMMLATINKTLIDRKVTVELTPEAKQWLVAEGYDARLGARPLRRTVQRSVENIVAKRLLEDDMIAGKTILLQVTDLEKEVS